MNNDATISCVLYANTNHPELRNEFPIWADRFKQILKKWRALSTEQKAPYLAKARENRSAIRMKKAQQVRQIIFIINLSHILAFSLLRVTIMMNIFKTTTIKRFNLEVESDNQNTKF